MDLQEKPVTFFTPNAPQPQQLNNVREYARQLSERKRLEDQRHHEDKFLRRSLRKSEKLRALANAKRAARDFIESANIRSSVSTDSAGDSFKKSQVLDYEKFIYDLRDKLRNYEAEGSDVSDIDNLDDREWEWLATKVSNTSVMQAFQLHDVIGTAVEDMRAKMSDKPMSEWCSDVSALKALDTVTRDVRSVPHSSRAPEMTELLDLLNSPRILGAMMAYDGVNQVWSDVSRSSTALPPTPVEECKFVERTVYPSPVEGCYKILAVDDQGNTVSTPDGITLVNVIFQKSGEDFFGATVRNEGSSIVIGRIISGGLIERTGLLNEGDELLSVNGIDLMGKDVDHVSQILSSLNGHIDLLVAPIMPITEASLYRDEVVAHLRALYSYEPSNDIYNPCAEASIAFDKGDILRVLNTRDPNWWQALKIEEAGAVGISGTMAGLVPSPYFQRYRCLLRLKRAGAYAEDEAAGYSESEPSEVDDSDNERVDASSLGTPSSLNTWISSSTSTATTSVVNSGFPGEDVASDEYIWSSHGLGPKQLKKLRQKKSKKSKLLGLVSSGAHNVSNLFSSSSSRRANEYEISKEIDSLKQADGDQLRQLVEESVRDSVRRPSLLTYELVDLYYPQPERKRPLVLVGPKHVGRQQLIEGLLKSDPKRFAMPVIHTTNPEIKSSGFQHYEVVTKADFQRMHKERAFVEWGVFNRHYYGTAVASIETIVKAGNVCVLALRPDSIRAIRRTPFLPCVIFVAPPDNLDEMRKLSKQWANSASVSDDELKLCMEASQRMEQHYGHFFEFLIVPRANSDALAELKQVALDLERRPQWVPAQWIDVVWKVAAQAIREAAAAATAAASSATRASTRVSNRGDGEAAK